MSANLVGLRAPQRRFQHLKAQDFDGFVKVPGIDAQGEYVLRRLVTETKELVRRTGPRPRFQV
jgi:hypothetical protein